MQLRTGRTSRRHSSLSALGVMAVLGATAACATAACTPGASAPRASVPAPPAPAAGEASDYDLVISNGRVVDGTGNPWSYGDIAVKTGRIARVTPAGMLATAHAARRVDARGLVVAPGFIDIQGQSVPELLVGDARVVSMITQGITTMILGEGETPAPANDGVLGMLAAEGVGPDTLEVYRAFSGPRGFGAWLDAMGRRGMSTNVGSFLGAATVRAYAKGEAEGPPTAAELDTMRRVVRDAMADGAFGVASALIYPPGSYAGTDELVEAAKAMAPYGGIYITHMRSEGDRLLEAMDEAILIGRRGGVPVEIYHLKAAGVRNWRKARLAIAKIDSARAAGQDVAADQYPYTAGQNNLSSCIPAWAHEGGRLLVRLRDPATRAKIAAEMRADMTRPPGTSGAGGWESLCAQATPAGVQVVGFTVDSLKRHEGKRLDAIARAMGTDWADAIIDLTLAEQNRLSQLIYIASDANVAMQIRQPWLKFGTDAEAFDPDSAKIMTHPRAYGTYPRVLGRYVREQHVLTLEDAVRKMTSAVANRLSIRDRGQLREGMWADMVVFDPATVIDRATYEKPHQISAGITRVFVNGVEVVRDGRPTGERPGMVVRGPGATPRAVRAPERK